MRFNLLSSLMVAMLFVGSSLADFDIWQGQICQLAVGPGQQVSCGYQWITSPAYLGNVCVNRLQGIGGLGANPCEKRLDMNGSWGTIRDCGDGSLGKADGAFYGNWDWYGARTTCIMWTTGRSGKSCSGLPEYWTSQVACKNTAQNGTP